MSPLKSGILFLTIVPTLFLGSFASADTICQPGDQACETVNRVANNVQGFFCGFFGCKKQDPAPQEPVSPPQQQQAEEQQVSEQQQQPIQAPQEIYESARPVSAAINGPAPYTDTLIDSLTTYCMSPSLEANAKLLVLKTFLMDRSSSCVELQDFKLYNDFVEQQRAPLTAASNKLLSAFQTAYGVKPGTNRDTDWGATLSNRLQLQAVKTRQDWNSCAEAVHIYGEVMTMHPDQLMEFAGNFRLANMHGLPVCPKP